MRKCTWILNTFQIHQFVIYKTLHVHDNPTYNYVPHVSTCKHLCGTYHKNSWVINMCTYVGVQGKM